MLKNYISLLLLVLITISTSWASDSKLFLAGFARSDITPSNEQIDNGDIRLGGMGLGFQVTGVYDHIFSRVFYLSNIKGEGILFISLDAPGISNRMIDELKKVGANLVRLPIDNIFVSVTHTHSGPDLLGFWGGVSKDYKAEVITKTTQAIKDAYRNRTFAYLFLAQGEMKAENRRGHNLTDPAVTTIMVKAKNSNQYLGLLVNGAAHPVCNNTKNTQLSRDFVGVVEDELEKKYGGTTIFLNGIAGDIDPPKNFMGSYPLAQEYGKMVATGILDSLEKRTDFSSNAISVKSLSWIADIDNMLMIAAYTLGRLEHKLILTQGFQIPLTVHTFYIGDLLSGITFPGEPLTRLGLPLKEKLKTPFKMALSLTDNLIGYIIPDDERGQGFNNNYEESIEMNANASSQIANNLTTLLTQDVH